MREKGASLRHEMAVAAEAGGEGLVGAADAAAAAGGFELDFDPNDPEVNKKVTKIQAAQRRRQAKKEVEARRAARAAGTSQQQQGGAGLATGLPEGFDPNDPDVHQKVIKIQAAQRRRQAKKEVAQRRAARLAEQMAEQPSTEGAGPEFGEWDPNDAEVR